MHNRVWYGERTGYPAGTKGQRERFCFVIFDVKLTFEITLN